MAKKLRDMTREEIFELEANRFAMCLLIPEHFLRQDLEEMGITAIDYVQDENIAKLAKRYQVSKQLMILRFIDLGLMQ